MQIVPTVDPILKPIQLSDWLDTDGGGCGFLEKAAPNWAKAISLQRRPLSCLQPVLLGRDGNIEGEEYWQPARHGCRD